MRPEEKPVQTVWRAQINDSGDEETATLFRVLCDHIKSEKKDLAEATKCQELAVELEEIVKRVIHRSNQAAEHAKTDCTCSFCQEVMVDAYALNVLRQRLSHPRRRLSNQS